MSDEIEPVFEIDDAVSYEWTHFAAYRHPTYPEKFTSWQDSGCSCDYWEPPTSEQLRAGEPLTRPQLRSEVTSYLASGTDWFTPAGTVRYLEEFEVAMNEAEKA